MCTEEKLKAQECGRDMKQFELCYGSAALAAISPQVHQSHNNGTLWPGEQTDSRKLCIAFIIKKGPKASLNRLSEMH